MLDLMVTNANENGGWCQQTKKRLRYSITFLPQSSLAILLSLFQVDGLLGADHCKGRSNSGLPEEPQLT